MDAQYIPIKTKKETGRVFLHEIIYIEKDLQKLNIHTTERTIAMYGKVSDIEQYLDGRFLQCHRSYVFNMDEIVYMREQVIYMKPNIAVPLGRECFRRGKKLFERYLEREKTNN